MKNVLPPPPAIIQTIRKFPAAAHHAVLCALIAVVVAFSGGSAPATASIFTQDDWSGGVGSDPTSQYASASNINTGSPNALTVDSGTNSDAWCNTATCDTAVPYRKKITVQNDNLNSLENYPVHITVPFESGRMNNDFSDIQFVQTDGTTDLSEFTIDRVTEGISASIWIKVPEFQPGSNYFYMYYGAGNNSHSGGLTFSDRFETGGLDADMWDTGSSQIAAIDSNQRIATLQNGQSLLNNPDVFNTLPFDGSQRNVEFAWEYDIRVDLTNQDCNSGSLGPLVGLEFTVGTNYNLWNDNCYNYGKYFTLDGIAQDYGGVHNDNRTPRFAPNQFHRFKTVLHKDQVGNNAYDFYYSTDGGLTFTKFDFYTPVSNGGSLPYLLFNQVGNQAQVDIRNVIGYAFHNDLRSPVVGQVEIYQGRVGSLTSAILNFPAPNVFGAVTYDVSGNGIAVLRMRSSANADMSGATSFDTCNELASGDDVLDSTCVNPDHEYFQYQLLLSSDSNDDLSVSAVHIEYVYDVDAPTDPTNLEMHRVDSNGAVLADNGWINALPYISWNASVDVGETGLAGYCVYLGSDNNPDLSTTAGLISASSQFDTHDRCQHGRTDTHIDSSLSLNASLQTGTTYYYVIQAIDNAGNLSQKAITSFRFDNVPPYASTLFNAPSLVQTKIFTVSWLTNPPAAIVDNDSGPAGFKYCLTNFLIGAGGCTPGVDTNFFGANHGSGRVDDLTDIFPFENGEFTTVPADADRLDNAVIRANLVGIGVLDMAGNFAWAGDGVVVIADIPPTAPNDLVVTPTNNTQNNFSFSWSQPTQFIGSPADLNYCWTVNEEIATDGSNCHWTGAGITQLAAGPYATKQGLNTLYLAAKDGPGNFDGTSASVTFTATTTAPGAPENLDISDVSTKATSSWRLALSWDEPSLPGSGIATYKILRSTDNSSFSEAGSTSSANKSFIDTNLSQVTYYYKVLACDNANSCSAASNTVSRKPTGRFTSPARLTADTDQPKVKDIGTKKATIFWFTDRESDSKVAFGTAPGNYFSEEIGNATQTANHNVTLTNLNPSTTYYYVARWTDGDGNTGVSTERSFTTAPAPVISEVTPSNLTINSAVISFRSKDAAKVFISYGKTTGFGGFTTINTSLRESSYDVRLTDLDDGEKYFVRLNGVDVDGNEFQGDIYTFTTPARPRITNLRFQPVAGAASSTQKVSWNTNVPTSSELLYGPKDARQVETLDAKLVTEHEVTISSLQDDTDYTLTARSRDVAGNTATSDQQTFKTSLDTRAPKLSEIVVEPSIRGSGVEARGQVIVSWKTDEPSTSQVQYGQGENAELVNASSEDDRLTTDHTVVLSGLPTSSIVRVKPVSRDKARNLGAADAQTVIIGRGSENIFSIIFNALQNIFGLGG